MPFIHPDPDLTNRIILFLCGKKLYPEHQEGFPLYSIPGYIRSAGLAEADPGVPSVLLCTAASLRAQDPRISLIQLKDEGLSISQKEVQNFAGLTRLFEILIPGTAFGHLRIEFANTSIYFIICRQ